MSQYGEGTATQNIYVEKPEDKDEISVRLSLFYDGTLNNRVNIDAREKNTKEFQKLQKKWFTSTDSFDNGRTNIAIMEPHLRVKKDSNGYDIALKEYIEGQGTFDLKGDSLKGYALGGGDSGVAGRAEDGIDRAVIKIAGKVDTKKECIKKLTIDVFGFSRGSATARYAIHLLLKGTDKAYDEYIDEYSQSIPPILESIANTGIEIQEEAVEICFAGLYDTVLSYYGSQKAKFEWVGNVLQQNAVKHAKKVLHLVAADEHRADFPLHNIKSAGSKGEEYYLPGVHSDVGGSYNKANEAELQSNTSKKVYMLTTEENKTILESLDRKVLEDDMAYLIKQGWYINDKKTNKLEIEIESILNESGYSPYDDNYVAKVRKLKVNRKNISSAYCNIPLKIMAKYARGDGVKLKMNSELDDRAEIILKPHSVLKKLEDKIDDYMASKKGNGRSKAEDWIGEEKEHNKFIIDNKIRHDHFNFSSHPGPGYSPLIKEDEKTKKLRRIRYIYNA